jgi:hypothetical protein
MLNNFFTKVMDTDLKKISPKQPTEAPTVNADPQLGEEPFFPPLSRRFTFSEVNTEEYT